MMIAPLAPLLDRLDRHVRRSHLRLGHGASRHRVTCSLDEALRLANLPGEEEGRLYCFRRVSVTGMPARASRMLWTDRVQEALARLAAQAVHGTDPRAGAANAVYFNHQEEALEMLLRHAVRTGSRAEWFSATILGVAPEAGPAAQIPAILERLRPPLLSPGAAAGIILDAIGDFDPAPLVAAVPMFMVRDWLREFEGAGHSVDPAPAQLPAAARTALQRAAAYCGWSDPRTIWLAALAIISISPAASARGSVVNRARSTLRQMESEERRRLLHGLESPPQAGVQPAARASRPLMFDDDNAGSLPATPSKAEPAPQSPAAGEAPKIFVREIRGADDLVPDPARRANPEPVEHSPVASDEARTRSLEAGMATPVLLGEPTAAAGLYFLLPVLRRLGIPAALEACPALTGADFVAHLLKHLAFHAGVDPADPILLCLDPGQRDFLFPPAIPEGAAIWPANFRRPARFDNASLPRVWSLAVRRWCRRTGGITVREIVMRKGLVWLTRNDLDVTLPLRTADVRIRRIGLDIDPGWLPWFGRFGRVVRFHYRDQEPAC